MGAGGHNITQKQHHIIHSLAFLSLPANNQLYFPSKDFYFHSQQTSSIYITHSETTFHLPNFTYCFYVLAD